MSPPFLIIDGYNLMHAMGLARHQYGPHDLETSRNRMLTQLHSLLNTSAGERTTVVFDAFASESDQQRLQQFCGISVVFAPQGTDADSEIEHMIRKHSSPRQLLVVSSDRRLQKAARRRRSRFVDSEQFIRGLSSEGSVASGETPQGTPAVDGPAFPDSALNEATGLAQEPDASHGFDEDYLNELNDRLSELDDWQDDGGP